MSWRVPVTTQQPLGTQRPKRVVRTVVRRGIGVAGDVTLTFPVPGGQRWRIVNIVWRLAYNADHDQVMRITYLNGNPVDNIIFLQYAAPYDKNSLEVGNAYHGAAGTLTEWAEGAQTYRYQGKGIPDFELSEGMALEIVIENRAVNESYGIYMTYEEVTDV